MRRLKHRRNAFRIAPGVDTNTLLHFDGDILDSAINGNSPHTYTNNNSTSDTTNKKWGSGSRAFNGTTANLTAPDSPDWDILGSNSDDWTADFQVRFADHSGFDCITAQYQAGGNYWYFTHNHGSGWRFESMIGGVNMVDTLPRGGEITDTNFHHVSMCKVSADFGIYVDGTQVAYGLMNSTGTLTGLLYIGSSNASSDFFQGNVDEYRIDPTNHFTAAPVVGLTDTITPPTGPYA